MRLSFQEKPWDLLIVIGYAITLGGFVLAQGSGVFVAILMVLFVPGYVLSAAIFPDTKEVDWTERILLSVGISVAVVPAIALVLNFAPGGISLPSVVISIVLFSVSVGFIAYERRIRVPPAERPAISIEVKMPNWSEYNITDKVTAVALSVSLVVASGALVFELALSNRAGTLTEFYLTDSKGNASDYPLRLNVSELGTVKIGIVNHERALTSYALRVDAVGIHVNRTGNENQTLEVNRTTLSWTNVTLADGESWAHAYTFSISSAGLWKIQFLLFKVADFPSVYLELHMFVVVGPA